MEGGGGVMFPVVFFDGEDDINVGPVKVDPSMEYKSFQLILSQMIGISPNQISIYLIDNKKSSPESRRRVPITGKANFAVISREKDCSFLAVLKRARKNRRSKPKQDRLCSGYVSLGCASPADDFLLLRRDSPVQFRDSLFSDNFPQVFHQNPSSDFNRRMRDLEIKRWNYNQAVLMKSNPPSDLKSLDFKYLNKIKGGFSVSKPKSSILTSCKECKTEKFLPLSAAAFHCCVNDAVIFNFRSVAGPIARPVKPF